jgi:flagellar hook-length control protein FliK
MMSTLNSSLMTLNNGKIGSPMPQVQPPAAQAKAQAQGKRFAQIMAKAEASSRPTPPPVQAKPAPPEKAAPVAPTNQPGSEASRAEANARSNAKTAARALATRALVKAPATEVNPPTEPRIEPHIAASDAHEAEVGTTKAVDATAAFSADLAAWVAALNPAAIKPAAAANAQPSGEMTVAESELASPMSSQTAGTTAADKNTQALRQETDAKEGTAKNGVTNLRNATDLSRSRFGNDGAGSDGAGQSGHGGQQADSRDTREALEVRGTARTPTDLAAIAPVANAMAALSKEITSPATASAATTTTDFSALMASSMSTASGTSATAETLTLNLPTPVNAPEFREALGVQVSLLARDGVQTAELHLNPADMGPVSIQIVMEGTQARVDFGADVAATRAAIDASMPELASALLDAGFTLAGGGVSQHAKGQSQAQTSDENRQGTTRRNVVASHTAMSSTQASQQRVQLTAGGVDLFA